MKRTYMIRSICKDTPIGVAEAGTLEKEIDLKETPISDLMARVTYAATASTSGLSISGVYGMYNTEGEKVYDTSTTPTDFGDVVVEEEQSEETLGTLRFAIPTTAPQLLKLSIVNNDDTNSCLFDLFGHS